MIYLTCTVKILEFLSFTHKDIDVVIVIRYIYQHDFCSFMKGFLTLSKSLKLNLTFCDRKLNKILLKREHTFHLQAQLPVGDEMNFQMMSLI